MTDLLCDIQSFMKKSYFLAISILALFTMASCSIDEDANKNSALGVKDEQSADPETNGDVDSEEGNSQAEASATYKITFIGEWTDESHPNAFPNNAHFSNTVLFTHNDAVRLYTLNMLASKGIEDMSEIGDNTAITEEMQQMINDGNANSFIVGPGSISGNGTDELMIEATQANSKLSYVAMIAPSPDWFTGLSAIALFENDTWAERIELDVVAYDAGTEEGDEFRFDNPETSPQNLITRITEAPLGNGTTVAPRLGRLVIELQQ